MNGGLLDALRTGVLVVDGAMGTQLHERGVPYSACFEALNLARPDLVGQVHAEYLRAGAQVIETNSFGANALRLEPHGLADRVAEINAAAVRIARAAAADRAYVVGAMGPSGLLLGDPNVPERDHVRTALLEQARALLDAGVDALVVETMRQQSELCVALDAATSAAEGRVPVVAAVSVDAHGRLADGTTAAEIVRRMREWGAAIVGVNCSEGPESVAAGAVAMLGAALPVWAAPNAGLPQRVDDRLVYATTPEDMGDHARRMFALGVKLVGGCCGTTPEHVRRIAAAARAMR